MKVNLCLFIAFSLVGVSVFGEEPGPVAEITSEFKSEPASSKESAVSSYYGETESSPGYRQLYFAFSEKPKDLVVRFVVTEPVPMEWEEADASDEGEYLVRTKSFVPTREGSQFELRWTHADKTSRFLFSSAGDLKELQQSDLNAAATATNTPEVSNAGRSRLSFGGGYGRGRTMNSAIFGSSLPPGFRPLSPQEFGKVDSLRSQIGAGRPGVVVTNDSSSFSGKTVEQMTLEVRRQHVQKYGSEPSQILLQRDSRGQTTVLGVPDRRR